MRESLRPPKPFDLLWAAIAARRSKKSKMIPARASLSTLSGINVLNESLAICESGTGLASSPNTILAARIVHTLLSNLEELVRIPTNNAALESAPAPFYHACNDLSRLSAPQLGFRRAVVAVCAIDRTIGSVIRSSCARVSPRSTTPPSLPSKKCRTKVRTALGSEVGRKGRRRNGRSRAAGCR
jgi:hypothetical protein